MNIYSSHKHYVWDIIGLESIVLSGGIISSPGSGTNTGSSYTIFPPPSLLFGISASASRSDHRHNNIINIPTTGNLTIDNVNGIYSIAINDILSNLVLDRTNTISIDASKFKLFNNSDKSAELDISTLTANRTYQLPNVSGVIVVSSVPLSDGSTLPSVGTTPPDIPRIILSECTSAYNSGPKTSSISVAIANPIGSTLLMNVVGFTLYYKQINTIAESHIFFSHSLSAGAGASGSTIGLFTVPGLIPGETYEFRVTARNALGVDSLYSAYTNIRAANSTTAPSTPVNLTTLNLYGGTVRIEWSQNTENDILEYRLYSSTTYPCTTLSTLIYNGINENVTYTFNPAISVYYLLLQVINKSGLASQSVTTTLLLETAPETPIITNPILSTGLSGGESFIDVSFTDSSVSNGKLIYIYSIYVTSNPGTAKIIFGTTTTNYRFNNLIPNTSYTIDVGVISASNVQSAYVNIGTIVSSKDITPPAMPTGLVYGLLYNTVNFTWNRNTEKDLKEYRLYLSSAITGASLSASDLKYTGTTNSALIDVGRGSTNWNVKVVAVDTSDNISVPASATFNFDSRPAKPTHLGGDITSSQVSGSITIDDLGQVSATLKIAFTDTARDGFGVYEYRIFNTIGQTSDDARYFTSPTSTFSIIVLPNVQYTLNVRYYDGKANISDWAVASGFNYTSPKNITPPAQPTGVTTTSGFSSIILKWIPPTNKDIKYFDVYRNTVNNSGTATAIAHANGNTYSDVGLSSGVTYYYWLKSINTSDIASIFSNVASGASIQLLPAELDTQARVDFIVKDIVFQFKHIDHVSGNDASTTLDWTTQSGGGIIFQNKLYTSPASGSILNANNSYVIATLTSPSISANVASFSCSAFGSSLPTLNSNQIIIALTSAQPLTETNNYACYVRQANSMALEGAIIREATITTAKIKDLDAAIVTAVHVNAGSIYVGGPGGNTLSLSGVADKAIASTRNVWQGAWSSTFGTYQVGDEVSYENSSWGCTAEHTSTLSTAPPSGADSNTWWSVRSKAAAGGATGATGLGALIVNLTNSSQNIQTDADGLNGIYNGTGTDITLSEGAVDLVYDGIGISNGKWAVSINSVNITAGTLTNMGTYVSTGDASNIIADTAYISFSLSGRRLGGEFFVINKNQTFNRIKAPVMYDVKILSSNGEIFRINDNKSTVLKAYVFRNGVDVTDSIIPERFRWERLSYFPDLFGDTTWNNLHLNGPKEINLTIDSVNTLATFTCTII